ncbi:TetR/AcrR family transcriptional regulator [Streptomyces roseirectus]|uniref:TetR/AcrR family transcriptional regulator n=1 Tax=Streptomyces roseirectus TaxID=2768066 RepID=A0A7H0I6X9_9ACTN|nr:TetR/AcrR family transcriptional regulator [Streptomyces roseirectus]QNP68545.1 TetR/AcrR family transcriptional regulator [Streptomyces roseirectus]
MTTPRKPRGPYRKGLERREQILRAALEVFSEHGERGASLKEVADRVGMSQAGVLHYFGSREELFVAVLAERDARDGRATADAGSPGEALARTVVRNAGQRGLVDLFVTLSAAASDPQHPAHGFFTRRYDELTRSLAEGMREGQERGETRTDVTPEQLARMLIALSDGLQLQWLLDPGVEMAETIEAFNRMCGSGTGTRTKT